MLFHVTYTPRPGLTASEQKSSLEWWSRWTPPNGFDIKSFHVSPEGSGFLVAEVATAEALVAANAAWVGVIFDYRIVPVIPIEAAVPLLEAAIAFRGA